MSQIFISHVEEDSKDAMALATFLEDAGFSTWHYQRDSLPGVSYLLQTGQAIDQSQTVLLLISSHSLGSHQVTKEVVRAHESNKPIVPLLLGVSHAQFQKRQPEWREAIGAAASLSVAQDAIGECLPKILDGLRFLGIVPIRASKSLREQNQAAASSSPGTAAPTPQDTKEGVPDGIEDRIESAEAYESIGDVWSAAREYGALEAKLRKLGNNEMADEMRRRAKANRSAAAAMMRGDT